jgi:glycosyltransferase involved in cell wall biosynthesis
MSKVSKQRASILAFHPIGNTFAKHAALAFSEAGALSEFHIALAAADGNLWSKLAKVPGLSEFERRRYPDALAAHLHLHPFDECMRLLASRMNWRGLVKHETGRFSVDGVFQRMDRVVARRIENSKPDACYAYEDGAYHVFEASKKVGTRCIYDLPIGYWRSAREIQGEECERLPEWADTMPALIDSDEKVARKDHELKLAELIVTASQFTASTIKLAPSVTAPIVTVPYGCPPPRTTASNEGDIRKASDPLRIIFVGSLSQRKGLAYLLDAVEQMGNGVELTLIGRETGQCSVRDKALKKHRWFPSISHGEVLKEMSRQDVLVFPSLFEGFGMVVTEALSQGVPVITTPHTCGPDILTEGQDGFVVPIRSVDAIIEKLELLRTDRERLQAMKEAALATSARLTWELYRKRLIGAVLDTSSTSTPK